MNQFNITTTGSDVYLDDFGLNLTHPESVELCSLGFSFSDILDSQPLQQAFDDGLLVAVDADGNTISSNSLDRLACQLHYFGQKLTWMQVNNSDTSTNINTSISQDYITIIPVSGTIQSGSNTDAFTKTSDGIQCNFDGVVAAFSNIFISSSGSNVSVQSRLRREGTVFGSVGSTGLITNLDSHVESSTHCMGITQVLVGEEITVGARKASSPLDIVSLATSGSSNLILVRLA